MLRVGFVDVVSVNRDRWSQPVAFSPVWPVRGLEGRNMGNASTVSIGIALCVGLVGVPRIVGAQGSSTAEIAGVVRDTSGGVLPGVTVEVSSPALTEKVRTTVTGDDGQYRLIELRPGTYSVKFTLAGFATFVREGLELPVNFTATINAELRVGTRRLP